MALKVNVIPDLPNTIPVVVATIILFLIFRHFMWNKVKNMLDKRADLVVSNLKESEEAKKASMVLKEEYEEKLQEAKDEASKIISNARQYSEELKSNAIKESKEEAKKEYERGGKSLELEKRKVLSSVNDDIVDLAMITAEKVLNKSADSKIDKNMVREFVNSLEASMNSKIVDVYTDALFKFSEEKNALNDTKNDLLYLRKVLDENEKLKELLQSPKVSKKDKKEIVDQVFPNIQIHTLNFVKILIDKTRFFYYDEIVDSFVSKFNEKEGISIGILTSAREMDEEEINLIKDSLSKKFGKKVELNYKLDPSLIGGFSVKLDGKMIDNSLKSRLINLKSSLKEKR